MAATSSSRIAIQARPIRESLSRWLVRIKQSDEGDADIVIGCGVDPEVETEEPGCGNAVETHRPVGDRGNVARDDRHDLAKTQGHDRQIIALEPQGRGAEQHPEKSGDRGGDRQHQPERDLEVDDVAARRVKAGDEVEPLEGLPEAAPRRLQLPRARHAIGIGADREKRGVAEVEQSGKADDDIEAERQSGEGQRIGRRIDVGVVLVEPAETAAPPR